MGFHASGDAYTRRFDDITSGVKQLSRCVHDSILWDKDLTSAFWHTFDYLKLCSDNGVVFNKDKFQFAQDTIEFAGYEISPTGYKPPKKILAAIADFPTPKNITDIRSWFGLINQVAYAFSQTRIMAPFRELLASKTRVLFWDDTMDQVFKRSKDEIIRLVNDGVRTFVRDRPTCLSTDWAKIGIGFALTQRHCNCPLPAKPNCGAGHWKLVFAGSRFTSQAESRYAPIEGEALALVEALKSCRIFILGCPDLIVAVDHKPLLQYFNDRQLDTIKNQRLLSLKERTL